MTVLRPRATPALSSGHDRPQPPQAGGSPALATEWGPRRKTLFCSYSFPLPFDPLKSAFHHAHRVRFCEGPPMGPIEMRMGVRSRPSHNEGGLLRPENLLKVNSFDDQNFAVRMHIS